MRAFSRFEGSREVSNGLLDEEEEGVEDIEEITAATEALAVGLGADGTGTGTGRPCRNLQFTPFLHPAGEAKNAHGFSQSDRPSSLLNSKYFRFSEADFSVIIHKRIKGIFLYI